MSVGSRSGSEGASAYECDSEGTSASEPSTTTTIAVAVASKHHRSNKKKSIPSLSNALQIAIAGVLDHSYATRGGYKLSTVEKHSRKEPTAVFLQRKQRLIQSVQMKDGPPFTIQRLAEVLLWPERYYTQTHKLCNCLEKLLLVTSNINAFGGWTGGETSQTRTEERELVALANERERLESEQRNRRLRRNLSILSSGTMGHHHEHESDITTNATTRPRHKQDTHEHESNNNNNKTNKRSMASSPPPPGLSNPPPAAPPNLAMVANFTRHLQQQEHEQNHHSGNTSGSMSANGNGNGPLQQPKPVRPPSPILFGEQQQQQQQTHPGPGDTNLQLLQMHHTARYAGVQIGARMSPLDIVIDPTGQYQHHHHNVSLGTAMAASSCSTSPHANDAEIEVDRSSASNSDSESDISLDDSASDRSDGSDYEPFTAARVMALNRMHQRLQYKANEPPGDTEYQSGDSIDSMMAEDSGGSDSSSSDMAD